MHNYVSYENVCEDNWVHKDGAINYKYLRIHVWTLIAGIELWDYCILSLLCCIVVYHKYNNSVSNIYTFKAFGKLIGRKGKGSNSSSIKSGLLNYDFEFAYS